MKAYPLLKFVLSMVLWNLIAVILLGITDSENRLIILSVWSLWWLGFGYLLRRQQTRIPVLIGSQEFFLSMLMYGISYAFSMILILLLFLKGTLWMGFILVIGYFLVPNAWRLPKREKKEQHRA